MSVCSVDTRELDGVYAAVETYYTETFLKHGPTPHGVDWDSGTTQEVRFTQLLKICDFAAPFSLNDVGCGYGALALYFRKNHADSDIDYLGFDLVPAMVGHAQAMRGRSAFVVARAAPRRADYSIASGVFNVKLDQPLDRWEWFIAKTLADMHATSRRGFAANFLAPHALGRAARPALYGTLPDPWIRYCEEEFGSSVELIADYGLREFTLLVQPRKSASDER